MAPSSAKRRWSTPAAPPRGDARVTDEVTGKLLALFRCTQTLLR
jgi:hypothetical protein